MKFGNRPNTIPPADDIIAPTRPLYRDLPRPAAP